MQILASALPGFRDLRAPLTAGYLWLILLWIVVKPDLTTRPTNEIAGTIYDLGRAAGPIWIGLGVGIAAYLIGCISAALSPALAGAIRRVWKLCDVILNWLRKCIKIIPLLPESNPRSPVARYWDAVEEETYQRMRREDQDDRTEDELHRFAKEYTEYMAEDAKAGIDFDVKLPATLLLAKESFLYTEADRLKAEIQFRLAISPPLIAIIAFVSIHLTPWWLLTLIPIIILLWQGHIRQLEYNRLMYGALERGLIESDSLETFRKLAESD